MIFINQRPVFSPLISKAVQMGYGTRLKENTHPPFILFLTIDPSRVDVNVHPQKREVRLAEESSLFQQIVDQVSKIFTGSGSFSQPLAFDPPPAFSLPEDFIRTSCKQSQDPLPWEMEEKPLVIQGKYCLMEKEGLILFDLAAAHARILFEQFCDSKRQIQPLLWPLELDAKDPETVLQLEKIGVECRWIGTGRIAVDALPSHLESSEFPEFYDIWKEGKKVEDAASRFCHRLQKRYSFQEAVSLWQSLQKCKDRLYDPLGKKIWTELNLKEVSSWLHRGS